VGYSSVSRGAILNVEHGISNYEVGIFIAIHESQFTLSRLVLSLPAPHKIADLRYLVREARPKAESKELFSSPLPPLHCYYTCLESFSIQNVPYLLPPCSPVSLYADRYSRCATKCAGGQVQKSNFLKIFLSLST